MQKVEPLMIEAHGARIPALGFGTWNLRDKICVRAVQQAILLGYRHIDTAQIYENERQVGEGIHATGIKRREIFVTTKIWTTHFAPNDLERSVKDSLVRLRMSEVDLALLHWPNPHVPLNETLGALAHIREQGLTRHIGVSNFTVALMAEAVATCPAPLVCNQIEYHPFLGSDQSAECLQTAWHGGCCLFTAGAGRGQGNPVCPGGNRRETRGFRDADCVTLAHPARCWCNSAQRQGRAHVGKSGDLRFYLERRRDEPDFSAAYETRPRHAI